MTDSNENIHNDQDTNRNPQGTAGSYTGGYTYTSKPEQPTAQNGYSSGGYTSGGNQPYRQPSYTTPGYQPNFTLPQQGSSQQGMPSKQPKAPKPKKEKGSGRGLKALGIAAAFVVFMGGAFGFGYLGSWSAMQNGDAASAPASSQITSYENTTGSNVSTGGTHSTVQPYATVEEVAAAVANSVVEITTESVETDRYFQQQITSGAGSGVIITGDGYIVTNNHVVSGASKITVTLRDGTQYEGTLVGTDKKTDIAVVKINATGLQPATLGDSSNLNVGELAIVIGNPLGQLGGTVTNGIISALDRQITIDGETMTLMQTNAAINPGNSGGGLFNSNGELVGIVNAKSGGTTDGTTIEGLGFAIPIDTAKSIIQDIIDYGYVQGRIDIGMEFLDVSDPISAMLYGMNGTGVYVTSVTSGSSAEKTGIRAGDQIVSLDGQQISSTTDITAIVDKHSVGDEIQVVVSRNGRQGSGTIALDEYKGESGSSIVLNG